ncbi:hypothetical protein SAMN06265218_105114 [Fodinibius sediminis]|uniref:Copper(I)-binding protein n=2 Tax=Fodinibius sediminis TaxID=1214077 RepID=A0A521C7E3_9BACT|nr:hypothetical protein SAMN06265218_105114 [Fodinibius sediminis]
MVLICSLLFLYACSSGKEQDTNPKEDVIPGKVELSDGWVRPGSKGMMSAVYLTISNGTAKRDTLAEVSSDVAKRAEVHESYKGENGMSGMRPAPNRIIEAGEELYLQPGGLHIMLISLNKDLVPGDSVEIDFSFKQTGTKTVRMPVKAQNP